MSVSAAAAAGRRMTSWPPTVGYNSPQPNARRPEGFQTCGSHVALPVAAGRNRLEQRRYLPAPCPHRTEHVGARSPDEAALKRTAESAEREQATIDRSITQTERDQARLSRDPAENIEAAGVLRQRLRAAAASLASKEDEVAELLDELASQHPERASEYQRAADKARDGAKRAREVQRHFAG
jgi:ribosomal protein L17